MQKRLTAKDWILYALIAVLITLLLLVMYQIDRQWLRLTEMQTALQAQAKDMRDLRSAVSRFCMLFVYTDEFYQSITPSLRRITWVFSLANAP